MREPVHAPMHRLLPWAPVVTIIDICVGIHEFSIHFTQKNGGAVYFEEAFSLRIEDQIIRSQKETDEEARDLHLKDPGAFPLVGGIIDPPEGEIRYHPAIRYGNAKRNLPSTTQRLPVPPDETCQGRAHYEVVGAPS